jgi:peptidoglycan/xylan/chitin deacetylase (PgdA/CDA1 family)
MHRLLKEPVERVVSTPVAGWITRRRVRAKRLILAYHGIIPEGEDPAGERALFVRQRNFISHLDVLAAEADVVPLARIDDPGNGRPRVAITFDDAYRGAVSVGVSELAARSLPATIFVAPARLNNHVFWWDALAHGKTKLDERIRNYALHDLQGADERIRAWAVSAGIAACEELPAYAQTVTRDELTAALTFRGITLGSHSWSHPNLASLDIAEVVTEVRRSREWLRSEFGEKVIDWLAYPYGLESAQVQVAVADAAYEGALRVIGGWHGSAEVSRFARPRLSIGPSLSVAGLRARLQGALLA